MSQTEETTAAPERLRRRARVVLLSLLIAVAVLLLLYFVALPAWIQSRIIAALREAGANDVELRVDGVSPWRIDVSNSSLGRDKRFHVRGVGASYNIAALRRGEVGVIDIDGAEFDLRVRDGAVDLGPFAGFKRGSEPTGLASHAFSLPFQRLEVRRSAIIIDWQGVRLHVPLECTITNEGPTRIGIDVTATVLDAPLRVHGTLSPPTASDAAAWGVDLSIDPLQWNTKNVQTSMKAVTITGKISPAGQHAGVELRAALVGGAISSGRWSLGEISAEVPISSASGADISGGFRIGSVVLSDRKMPPITGTIGASAGRARFSADWPALASVKVGTHGWIDSGLNGEVNADVASFELSEAKELTGLVPEFKRLDLSGQMSIAAVAKMVVGQVSPSVLISTKDVKLTDKESGVSIAGITGDFAFDPRTPMASASGQKFHADSIAMGADALVNDVALRIGNVSPTHIEVLDFSLGKDQRLRIDSFGATFDSTTTQTSRAGVVGIGGAAIDVRIRDGVIDLGPLAKFQIATGDPAKKKPTGDSAPKAPSGLPFHRLEVRKSAVVVDWQGVRLQIPVECTITNQSAREIGVDVSANILDRSVRFRGSLTAPDAGDGAGVWGVNLTADPINWSSQGVNATMGSATITGKITSDTGNGVGVELQLTITGGAVNREGQALSEIVATLPIVMNSGAPTMGRFNIGKVVLGDQKLPPISGTIGFANNRAEFAADWTLLKAIPVMAKGWIDSGLHAEATATVAPFELKDAKGLEELAPALAGLDLNGTFSMDASVKLVDGKMTPRVTVHAKEAKFVDKDAGLMIEGIDTDVTFTRFTNMGTRGGQKLTVRKLTLGDVTLLDGETSFQIERPDSFLIEKTLWHWDDGGIMRFYGARVEPNKPIAMEVFLEDIGVERWIALLVSAIGGEPGKVEGEGKMYGRVPLVFTLGDKEHPLAFGKGFLYANPGMGWYKLSDKTFVSAMMAGLNVASITQDVRASFEEALTNFEYSTLTFEFVPVADGLSGVLFVKGKNHNPAKPINFQGLTANFNGLDQGLNAALTGSTGWTKFTDAIKARFKPR